MTYIHSSVEGEKRRNRDIVPNPQIAPCSTTPHANKEGISKKGYYFDRKKRGVLSNQPPDRGRWEKVEFSNPDEVERF